MYKQPKTLSLDINLKNQIRKIKKKKIEKWNNKYFKALIL